MVPPGRQSVAGQGVRGGVQTRRSRVGERVEPAGHHRPAAREGGRHRSRRGHQRRPRACSPSSGPSAPTSRRPSSPWTTTPTGSRATWPWPTPSSSARADLVVLAGYMQMVTPAFLEPLPPPGHQPAPGSAALFPGHRRHRRRPALRGQGDRSHRALRGRRHRHRSHHPPGAAARSTTTTRRATLGLRHPRAGAPRAAPGRSSSTPRARSRRRRPGRAWCGSTTAGRRRSPVRPRAPRDTIADRRGL